MTSISRIVAFVFALVTSAYATDIVTHAGNTGLSHAQSSKVFNREIYERFLDLVFPRTLPQSTGLRTEFVLRFEPDGGAESQIVVAWGSGGKTVAVEYSSTRGGIGNLLIEELNRTGNIDESQIAKTVSVRRREVSVTFEQAKKWRQTFFDSLLETAEAMRNANIESEKTGQSTLIVDGAGYEVSYEGGDPGNVSLFFQDVLLDGTKQRSRFKIVEWMKSVRAEVSHMK
jgi:hypothetical protein